jgi:hypothetical protein
MEVENMPKNGKSNSKVQQIDKIENGNETILVFRALKALTDVEHEQLSGKIRFEEERSGVKIVLMPYSCDFESGLENEGIEQLNASLEKAESELKLANEKILVLEKQLEDKAADETGDKIKDSANDKDKEN